MAIQSRKISSFANLPVISGDEVIMVAYKGKTYKVPLNMLTGNAIQSITQHIVDGDLAANPITVVIGTGNDTVTYTFTVYNGAKGSKGEPGDVGEKGPQGDTGVAIYNADILDLIRDAIGNGDEEELSQLIITADQGVEFGKQLDELAEVYLDSQEEYDELLAKGEVYDNVKYFIYEN